MAKDKDVEVSQTSPDSSGEEKEQANGETEVVEAEVEPTVTKDVEQETDAEPQTDKAKNLDKAIKAETKKLDKLRELREEKKELQKEVEPTQEPEEMSDVQQRFLKAEANATIALKAQEDPAFKKRVQLVIRKMQDNPALSVDQADNEVKAGLLDQILKQGSSGKTTEAEPNQINTSATPETQPAKEYTIDEIAKGEGEYDPAYRQALKNILS